MVTFKKEISINLTDGSRSQSNIGIDWVINIEERRKSLIQKLFSSSADKIEKRIQIDVEKISVSPDLVTSGPLITVAKDGVTFISDSGQSSNSALPMWVDLDSLTTSFQVFLNEENIIDCAKSHDLEPLKRKVCFLLTAKDEQGERIDSIDVVLDIVLTRVENEPEIELLLDEEIQYDSSVKETYIGDFTVRSSAMLNYAAPVSVKGRLTAFLDEKSADNLLIIKKNGTVCYGIDSKDTKKGDEDKYELFLRMSELCNPTKDRERFQIVFNGYYDVGSSLDHKHLNIVEESLEIHQDAQGTELSVSTDGRRIFDGSEVRLPAYEFFARSPLTREYNLEISNIAKDTSRRNAGLKVLNLGVSSSLPEGVKIYGEDDAVIDIGESDVFAIIASEKSIKSSEGVIIPNGPDSKIELQLLFSPDRITKVTGTRDYTFETEVKVSFEYYENKYGEEYSTLDRKSFTATFIVPLFLKPNPQWLCVDYGSSAIVCLYDKEIINLRERKSQIIKEAISVMNLQKDDFEKNTKFLSSDIVFHTVSSESRVSSLATEHQAASDANSNLKSYNDLAVFLSPTSGMYVNETLRLLPCLKLLVGNTWLPKNNNFLAYEYNRLRPEGIIRVKAEDDRRHDSSLLRVDQVFRQSYEALFRYYIASVVPNRNSINRLVLTYPNTYTPRHITTLRGVVKSAFPSVRELQFVSESDAVAAYYLKHWYDYSMQEGEITDNENILVFDMGAGTLDVSFVSKTTDKSEITLEILGKLGTSKAGNYLDFVLAKIVSELTNLSDILAETNSAPDEETSRDRTQLKLFVKTNLKPLLCEAERSSELTYNKKKFTVGAVMDHNIFSSFLEDVSDKFLKRLVNYMNPKSGVLPINTVLMSGRSCLLEPLQEKLKVALGKITDLKPRYVILDSPIRKADNETDRQKIAVAEGAMEMADNYRRPNSTIHVKSRRHYASFGLAYETVGGKMRYKEILNHHNIPESNLDNLKRFTTETVTISDLNNVRQLILIQSYLSAADTENALNNQDYEFVTEMEVVDTQALGNPSAVEAKLCIDENNDIIIYFGTQRTRGQQPQGEDLQSEETKRSIWPVTI